MHTRVLLIVCGEMDERAFLSVCLAFLLSLDFEGKKGYFSGLAADIDPPDLASRDISLRINSCRTLRRSARFVLGQLEAC